MPAALTVARVALAFAALVPARLLFALVDRPDRHGRRALGLRIARAAQLPAAAALAAGLAIDPGPLAAALTVPWLLCTAAAAVSTGRRLLARGLTPIAELGVDAAPIALTAGAAWATLYAAGAHPLDFSTLWVIQTGVHFHYGGACLPLIAALLLRARTRPSPLLALALAGTLAAVPLTAAGIGARIVRLEQTAVVLLAASAMIVALYALAARRVLLAIAGLALLAAMPLAVVFALAGTISVETMAVTHGALNALGFATLALAALATDPRPPAPHCTPGGIPFSSLRARGHVGAGYFTREGLVTSPPQPPLGLVDRLEELAHDGLDPARVPAEIRDFYQRTAEYTLLVTPGWRPGFRLGGRLFVAVARRLFGNLVLPTRAEQAGEPIDSRIVPLDATRDGRPGARGWLRTYARDGGALYIAAYATHRHDGVGYMNIAFPLPFANLASILRMDALGTDGAVEVTTRARPGRPGDSGIWLSTALGPLRLPLEETIRVWTPRMRGAPPVPPGLPAAPSALAQHDLWVFGMHYLTLTYVMFPRGRMVDSAPQVGSTPQV